MDRRIAEAVLDRGSLPRVRVVTRHSGGFVLVVVVMTTVASASPACRAGALDLVVVGDAQLPVEGDDLGLKPERRDLGE